MESETSTRTLLPMIDIIMVKLETPGIHFICRFFVSIVCGLFVTIHCVQLMVLNQLSILYTSAYNMITGGGKSYHCSGRRKTVSIIYADGIYIKAEVDNFNNVAYI